MTGQRHLERATAGAGGKTVMEPVRTLDGVEQSFDGIFTPASRLRPPLPRLVFAARRRRGLANQPAIVQVKRVSLPRGARPPGRIPRRTRIVAAAERVARAVRARPRPSRRQRSVSPTTTMPASAAAATRASGSGSASPGSVVRRERVARRSTRSRVTGSHRGHPRHVEAPIRAQRNASAGKPRCELDRRPVVISASERDDDRPSTAVDDDADVARGLVQEGDDGRPRAAGPSDHRVRGPHRARRRGAPGRRPGSAT